MANPCETAQQRSQGFNILRRTLPLPDGQRQCICRYSDQGIQSRPAGHRRLQSAPTHVKEPSWIVSGRVIELILVRGEKSRHLPRNYRHAEPHSQVEAPTAAERLSPTWTSFGASANTT